jgi:ADP-heptose:LPS heptosyltransferase
LNSIKPSTCYNISQERGILNDELVINSGAVKKICFQKNAQFLQPIFNERNNSKYSMIYNTDGINEYKKGKFISDVAKLEDTPRETDCKAKIFSSPKGKNKSDYIVVAPLSSDIKRGWGLNHYSTLVSELSKIYTIIILGEKKYQSLVSRFILPDKKIKNLFGLTSLKEAAELISCCRLFIGNDSGLTHVAKYYNRSIVAIIGGGMYGRFFPIENDGNKYWAFNNGCFGCGWNCTQYERICLTKVSFNEVYYSCMDMIDGNKAKS